MRIDVPDQRNVPARAGWILKNGAVTGFGIRPRATIGSEKTTVISRDSPRSDVSPAGLADTTVSRVWASDRTTTTSERRQEATSAIRVSMCPREGWVRAFYRHMAELPPDGRPAPGPSSAEPLDTGFFAVAVGAVSTDAPPALPPDLHGRRRAVRHPRRLRLAGTPPRAPRDRPATCAAGGGDHPEPHRYVGGRMASARRPRNPRALNRAERRCAVGDLDRSGSDLGE